MKKTLLLGLALVLCAAPRASAQEPTCKSCPSTYIDNAEIQAYVKRAIANKIVDQQVRAVDIGKSNVAIGVVHRGKLDKPAPRTAWRSTIWSVRCTT